MRLEGVTILVTGGRGYVGSHTAKSLRAAGAKVYTIDNRYVEQNKVEGTKFYMSNYDDYEILDMMEEFGVDGVVHCAGTSLVGPSVLDPSEYYNNNVVRTIRMLDHMKKWKHKPFIVFSSSAAVYGNPTELPIKESSITKPVNPYGNTKMMIEHILRDYDAAYGMRNFCFRYFNAAGADVWDNELGPEPGDTHLIPRIFEAQMEGKVFSIYGDDYDTPDGTCVRDYIHVCDLALAHLRACEVLSSGGKSKTYNLGTSTGYSNQEVVNAFFKYVTPFDICYRPRRAGDPDSLVADASKFEEEQGQKLAFSDLETIIMSTKDYYEKRNK